MVGRPGRRGSRRELLGLAGAGAVAAGLAACGNGGAPRSASTRRARGTAAGRPRISQWYHQYGEPGTRQAVRRYAAGYRRADVTVGWIPGNYDQKAAAALLTSSGPDVFEYENGPTIDMITSRQVVDLTGLLGAAEPDFNPSLLRRMTYRGKLYGIPQVEDMQLFVYRRSMLKKAGVKPPTTLDELITAAAALTRGRLKGLFLGNDGGAAVLGGPILWSSGHDFLTDTGRPDFNHPVVIRTLVKLHRLFRSGHLLLDAPADWSDPTAITQGLTAIQWTGLWALPQAVRALGDDFGVLPFPRIGTAGRPSVPVGAYASCVSARATDIDVAKAFVKWLWVDQTGDQLDFAQSYGFHIPARTSLIAKATRLRHGEARTAVGYLRAYGHPQTPLLWTPASRAAFNDALGVIIRSGADPEATMSGVQGTVLSELRRFGPTS